MKVVYNLENDRIIYGRVYFEIPALLHQLGIHNDTPTDAKKTVHR